MLKKVIILLMMFSLVISNISAVEVNMKYPTKAECGGAYRYYDGGVDLLAQIGHNGWYYGAEPQQLISDYSFRIQKMVK